MIDRRSELRLAEEPLAVLRRLGDVVTYDLQCYETSQRQLSRLVHDAHPAFTGDRDDLVVGELMPGDEPASSGLTLIHGFVPGVDVDHPTARLHGAQLSACPSPAAPLAELRPSG